MNNLEWLIENDREALVDGMVCSYPQCDECKFGKPGDDTYCALNEREWLMAEHVDSRESNEMSNETDTIAERVTERADSLQDSREKLEADMMDFFVGYVTWHDGGWRSIISGWLDRQAAIKDREWERRFNDDMGEEYEMRKRLVKERDELTAERDAWRKRFEKANREKCDLQSSGVAQRFNNLCNRLKDKGITIHWDDSRSDYLVLLPQERTCPGYDPERNRCNYHAQDFELNDSTVSRLKRENAKLSSDELHWRNQAQAFKAECEHLRGMLLAIAVIATDETDGGLA